MIRNNGFIVTLLQMCIFALKAYEEWIFITDKVGSKVLVWNNLPPQTVLISIKSGPVCSLFLPRITRSDNKMPPDQNVFTHNQTISMNWSRLQRILA